MLRIYDWNRFGQRMCDGLSRRGFLQIGGLSLGGLTLPQLLAAESAAGIRRSHKSLILIYLCGGPPHQDMFDIKVDAPSEVRGPFQPIPTAVPGIEISEHLPRIAKIMDKLVGRTPKINKDAGRDHWPHVSCALLAGGGMQTGQVVGSTDRLGGEASTRPVTFPEVFATLYHNLGIDLDSRRLFDFRGRPQYLVAPEVKPLPELI